MPLAPGTWLGQYEILSLLGVGGMGEVYHARDNKLTREVALKLLPKVFASDPERLARFRREAQVLAQLNHPNIAAIYNLETIGETHFLVLEYVPGETLRERIKRGAVPLEESLDICGQICEGLEHAHEKPIVHRDLKPANVKVKPDGQVKILDFGLAKAFQGDTGGTDPSDSPTLSAMTQPGVILGTAAYMSPQQARAKSVDKRADIWALGCVLYELLTGQQAFGSRHPSRDSDGAATPAATVQDILAQVLAGEPDWTSLPPTTPASVRVLLKRCLEKDPKRRFRDASDLEIQLEDAAAAPASAARIAPAIAPRPVWRRALPWAVAAVMSVAIGLAVWNLKPTAPRPVSRTVITLPPGQRLAALDQPAIAISPDGKNLVYVAIQTNPSRERERPVVPPVGQPPLADPAGRDGSDAGVQQLYLRPLDSQEAKPIAGTEGAVGPFFSPDGQWIGFFAGGGLKKVSVNGGAAVTLANTPIPGGASWSSQGTLALQATTGQGLQQVSQEGGTPQPLTPLGKGEVVHRWPEFLLGGKAVLFAGSASIAGWNNAQIVVSEVERPAGEGERKNLSAPLRTGLAQGGTQPRYAASGHLLYVQSGTLMAAPFDARRLALIPQGGTVHALEGVMESLTTGAAQYSVSSTGTLVYLAGSIAGSQSRLVWVSRNGEEQLLPAAPHNYQFPRVSPDGRRVAVGISEQETQVWIYDVSRDTLTRLTFEGNTNAIPAWSPDGRRIAFRSNRAGPGNLFWQASDGSGGAEQLTTSEYLHSPTSFTPDGQLLAFMETNPGTWIDIWVLRLADPATAGQGGQGRKAQPFLRTPYEDAAPKFSPDGRWLAYCSNESGRREVYVQPYPGPGGKWQISSDGGQEPVWNPNGRELFYRSGSKIMAVDIEVGQASPPVSAGQAGRPVATGFSAGKPRMLFEGPYLPTFANSPFYDVSPDGQRFLMLKPVDPAGRDSAPTQINVVLNWFEELKRRVPVR